jgi:N-carbamoylputrescine amidase
LNQGYLWSASDGARPLRSKCFFPEERGTWEATWFDRGDAEFPLFRAGAASFGLNVCSELWALETYTAYAALGADLVLSPRATEAATQAKWLALGIVGAMRSGAYSVSSNRVDPTGACGGGGWIVDPSGEVLAVTSRDEPFATRDLDLSRAGAQASYPRYLFASPAQMER